ncbi:TIGR03016 family PEP-CTERM system-associated outer membrane protein [Emcibacter sp. SYSU 3D8]|uniref:TIGR03016 family PEP-CTERM system-associated outer membrane protein n=1 Tax=Emcibacter sp. SYSU 3D8 TaxID=3133969 RepID=UPI0031FF38B9
MRCRRATNPRCVVILSLAVLPILATSQTASAAKWRVTPRLEAQVAYTDNVDLDNAGKESDLVFRVEPGLAIKADGNRLKFQADYDGTLLHFVNDGRTQWRNHLRSKLHAEVIEDHFYIDATGVMAEPFVDNTGSVTFSDTNFSINRRQTMSYSVEPSFEHRLFDIADMRWTYLFRYVTVAKPRSDDPTPRFIDSYMSHRGQVSADSGDRLGRFHWGATASYDRRHRGDGREAEEIDAHLDLEYRIVRWLGVTGTAGYQKITDPDLNDDINGLAWHAGLRFNPTRNTDVKLWYGKQDGENSFGADAVYRRKRWKFGVTYLHQITTTHRRFADINEDGQFNDFDFFVSDFGSLLDPDDIVFGIENDTFGSNRLEVNAQWEKRLFSWDARAYYEVRKFDTTDREIHEYDIKTRFSQRLNHRTRAVLHLRHRHTDFDLGPSRVDNFYGARAELHYTFSKYLDAELAYVFSLLDSNQSINDQTENVIQFNLRVTF